MTDRYEQRRFERDRLLTNMPGHDVRLVFDNEETPMGRAEERRIGKLEQDVEAVQRAVDKLLIDVNGLLAKVPAVDEAKLKAAVVKAHDEAFKDCAPPPSDLGAYTRTPPGVSPVKVSGDPIIRKGTRKKQGD